MLKPGGHTVSTSDLYFVAHKLERASTVVGEIARLEKPDVVVLDETASNATLKAGCIVKCVGFHTKESATCWDARSFVEWGWWTTSCGCPPGRT